MEGCCLLVILIAIGYACIKGAEANAEENKKREARISRNESILTSERESVQQSEKSVYHAISNFFCGKNGTSYDAVYDSVIRSISAMHSTITQMKKTNDELIKDESGVDRSASISQIESNTIPAVKRIADGFKAFGQKNYKLSSSKMMDANSYGKINKVYWDSVCAMQRDEAIEYITKCERLLNSERFAEIYAIDIEEVLKCVWFFATEKTFSASDFQKAESVFNRIYKYSHADLIIADLYAKKKMGGEDVLRDHIRNLLKVEGGSNTLTLVASGLMWMNAYQTEHAVLQHMLTTGKEMSAKTQERLHSLTNGGGKAPSGFDVKSSVGSLYFDVSALAWKDDEYIGLFENLAFQDKTLAYSLAIRDENKDLFIPQGINVPSTNVVLNKFKAVFTEEYGPGVAAQAVNCIALSGSGEEKMDGILVSANECKQMGILIHIARIGKKLIIKFYTMFMPTGSDLAAQKQQALSMYKKLSPTVTMWESSLKDTMLMAVEQLLNTTAQSDFTSDPPDVDPIF